jgi:3-hydroxyisobutyrate dehydrogenase
MATALSGSAIGRKDPEGERRKTQIGYVGLGAMGGALASRIATSHPLIVLDLNKAAVAKLEKLGASAAASPADLAQSCDVVILCLPRSSDVRKVIFGPNGLAEGLSPGKLVIDQTSGIPSETRGFAEELGKLGVALVDAPVAGGTRGAEAGTVTMMLSGPDDAYARAVDVLRLIGPNVFHSGKRVGDGQAMKLVNNAMNANLRFGTLEVVALGRKMGLSLQTMIDILNKGSGRNYITKVQLNDLQLRRPSTVFGLDLMLKDVTAAATLGIQNGAPMPITGVTRSLLQVGVNTLGENAQLNDIVGMIERMASAEFLGTENQPASPRVLQPSRTRDLKVGFVGLGTMGGALVRRILLSRPVHVFDVRPELGERLAAEGAIATADLPSLARQCDVIMTCVPTSADVRNVMFGNGGLAEGLSAGKIVVDHTTGDPTVTRAIAADLEKLGVALVDAPVSGGPRGAAGGTIAIMCGGPVAEFEAVRPILASISPNTVYCGRTGNGHVAKLINNAVASCNRMIAYEGATVGFKFGLTLENMAVVLNKGSASSDGSERILPKLATGEMTSDFRIALMVKDLRLAAQMGYECGAPMMVATTVRNLFEAGLNEFGPEAKLDDMTRLFEAMGGFKFAAA